ncbi:hypothetical protein [Halioxenophilus aromaticivorans]|uniref:hypothetical protein n=1 Tax=Halioxenophilus aromaticivorans TaxID=1306992 RepID=UPI0031EB1144
MLRTDGILLNAEISAAANALLLPARPNNTVNDKARARQILALGHAAIVENALQTFIN